MSSGQSNANRRLGRVIAIVFLTIPALRADVTLRYDLQLVSGHPLLVQAAVNAVKQWVYQPAMVNGAPAEIHTMPTVKFSLSESGPAAAAK